jgi:iron complex transport system substrate-binding protein
LGCAPKTLADIYADIANSPGRQISAEEVTGMNPEVGMAAWCGAGNRAPLEKIMAERNWQGIRAVRACRVYWVRDEDLNPPGPTLLRGLDALAPAIHPELFRGKEGIRQITGVPSFPATNLAL